MPKIFHIDHYASEDVYQDRVTITVTDKHGHITNVDIRSKYIQHKCDEVVDAAFAILKKNMYANVDKMPEKW